MIEDINKRDDGSSLETDLCIVGAGAAGISLALQFIHADRRVMLLEAGSLRADEATQSLYAGTVANERLHAPPDRFRQRRFGGSTTIWGGRCMPFDPIDFESRPYIHGAGWPFGRETLDPYYRLANELCEAGDFAYTAEEAFPSGMREIIEGFRSDRVSSNTLERFSRPTDFGRIYGKALAAATNLRILLNANVTRLQASEGGERIESLEVRSIAGKRFTVRASQFVLATGGIEVPRLLLASNDVHKAGIGNGTDLVGRTYMCHVAGTMGELTVTLPASAVSHGYEISADGIYCRRRFAVNAATQRALGIGNIVARLHHPRITDPSHGSGVLSALYLILPLISYEYGKRFRDEDPGSATRWLGHVRNVVSDAFGTAGFFYTMLTKRVLASRKFPSVIVRPKSNRYSVEFHAEQEPNPASRITLSNGADRLGVPQVRIDWRYTPTDIRTVALAYEVMAEEFARSGCGHLDFDRDRVEEIAMHDGAYGGHHLGTARMGTAPSTGVVDADCKVHGIANLHVAGGAVFPTSSQANPTLTIVALALRLAERLKGLG